MSKLTNNLKTATDAAKTASANARRNASAAATRGVESSRAFAKKAGDSTVQTVDQNPLAIVVGGVALGAILGMLLPKTEREKKAFGKAGKKLNKAAKRAAEAAKTAGKEKVDALGLSQDALRDQFRVLVNKAAEAVKAAGAAAAEEARRKD